jgi:hypothetical protein
MEFADAMPNHGEEADIHPCIYQRVLDATANIATLRAREITLEKALEVCRETRGKKENNREDDISAIATKAETQVDKGKKPQETRAPRALREDHQVQVRDRREGGRDAPEERGLEGRPGQEQASACRRRGPAGR